VGTRLKWGVLGGKGLLGFFPSGGCN